MTSTNLVETLKEMYPSEVVEPFGEVIVIPNRIFKTEWREQLQNEGVKIYAQGYHGETCFFLKENSVKSKSDVEASPLKFKSGAWSNREKSLLKELVIQGLTLTEIEDKLHRSRKNIRRRIRDMGLSNRPQDSRVETEDRPAINEDGIVKELLSAASLLYPSHKEACALLLREASNKILAKEVVSRNLHDHGNTT